MRRSLAIVAALVCITLTAVKDQAPAQSAQPAVSFVLAKSRFLSTETPSGTLTIANPTGATIYYPDWTVRFALRNDDGSAGEVALQSFVRMVGTPVPPGATRRFELRLPDCEVLSDPCSRSVTLKLSLQVDGKYGAFELPPVNYTLMPDPNATFQGSGLHDNLPLFVVQGEAAGAVLQRDLEIAFQFSAPQQRHETPPPECGMIADIFARQGLHAEWRFVDDREGFQVRILLHKQAPGPAVDAALGGVRRAFGSRASLMSTEFVPNAADIDAIVPAARDDAQARADRVLHFFGDGQAKLVFTPPLSGFLETKTVAGARSASGLPFEPYEPGGWSRIEDRSATQTALTVYLRDTAGFAGTSTIDAVRFKNEAARSYVGARLDAAVLPIRATTGADRPEIYAVAATTEQQADRFGYRADALALSLALVRARALAVRLGAGNQWISLVAEYPIAIVSKFSSVRAAGIALAPSGTLDATWRRLAAATTTQSPLNAADEPPDSRYDAAPFADPIELPDWRNRLVVEGDRAVLVTADRLRLSVSVETGAKDFRDLPIPASVSKMLAGNSMVRDVAIQARDDERLPAGYQIVMKWDDDALATVLEQLRRAYRSSGATFRFDVKPALDDCDAAVAHAQDLSLDDALRSAIARAQRQSKPLRHLVVAAALAPSIGNDETCDANARPESLDVAVGANLQLPARTLTVHAPIELAFRTGSPPRAVARAPLR